VRRWRLLVVIQDIECRKQEKEDEETYASDDYYTQEKVA